MGEHLFVIRSVAILDLQLGEIEATGEGIGLEGMREGDGYVVGIGLMDLKGDGELQTKTGLHGAAIHWTSI